MTEFKALKLSILIPYLPACKRLGSKLTTPSLALGHVHLSSQRALIKSDIITFTGLADRASSVVV